ncbi:MAG: helix-turn-helix domain-containing protein [Thermoanaerobaculia bacterium]|nr:helix-turn-helix domain-containing protein [Thermoanaerobaculia bacterium]
MAIPTGPEAERTRVRLSHHVSAVGRWETAVALPGPALRPYVREYVGWWEHMTAPLVRRELPSGEAPLILGFGTPIRLFDPHDDTRHDDLSGFVTGAYDVTQRVGSSGPTGGVELKLTLLGMRRLLARPLAELRNRAVPLEEVFGRAARSWSHQLADSPSWEARFDLVDALLGARLLAPAHAPRAEISGAWHRLAASHGQVPIARVAQEVGWSPKHLNSQFRHEIGLAPKTLARILRFGRVVERLQQGRAGSLADLAAWGGYFDQSHLHRDARQFAGVTPGELVASLLPDRGGFLAS